MRDHFMNDLSFLFVMDLYRIKVKAEAREDIKAIQSLKQHYPELFVLDFSQIPDSLNFFGSIMEQLSLKKQSLIPAIKFNCISLL